MRRAAPLTFAHSRRSIRHLCLRRSRNENERRVDVRSLFRSHVQSKCILRFARVMVVSSAFAVLLKITVQLSARGTVQML